MFDEATGTAVVAAFELGELTAPPTYVDGGVQGEVSQVSTTTGAWALKRLFEPPDIAQVELEVTLQEAAYAAGVVSPLPRRTADGAVVAVVGATHWRANEWLPATPVGTDRLADVGTTLACLHGVRLPATHDVSPWLTTPPSRADWEKLRTQVNEAAPAWRARFADLYPELLRLSEFAASVTDHGAVLSHCDFAPANVGVNGDRVVVFDWGRAGAVPPRQELGYALWHWVGAGDPAAVVQPFMAGYRDHAGRRFVVDVETFGYAANAWLNFLRACAGAGNDRFVVPMLDRPMTLDEVRSLADLAA